MSWIDYSFPGLSAVHCVFTTRTGGVSTGPFSSCNLSFDVGDNPDHVCANRRRLGRECGISKVSELRQVHGVQVVDEPQSSELTYGPVATGDGQATSQPAKALMIKTADCQPILLAHCSGRYVAALHCGWKGNRHGFPIIGVEHFCLRYELKPEDVFAVRGPSLGPARSEFINFECEWTPDFADYFQPLTRTMDLWTLTRDQLITAGLKPSHIFGVDLCTFDNAQRFFSYRRDKTCGRQAGLIWISPP